MRPLTVDLNDLKMAMQMASEDFPEGPQQPWLDLQTGEVVWVWEDDEAFAETTNADPRENARLREATEAVPSRYAAIPDINTTDDNEMLRDFLRSDWTGDDELWRRASSAYHGSIGRWKRAIHHDPAIMDPWHRFEDQEIRRRALEFLAELDIQPI